MNRAGDKTVFSVKFHGLIIERVYKYRANADLARDVKDSTNRVLEQSASDALALMISVNSKAAENNHRDMIGLISPEFCSRQIVSHDCPGRQSVITDNSRSLT